ncbi:MAG TPA: DUF1573 domain-containing protein [Saprospiraceae bacterium]|nr:DUF1573 domain-containing protein [Saprospiraceae bacterium]
MKPLEPNHFTQSYHRSRTVLFALLIMLGLGFCVTPHPRSQAQTQPTALPDAKVRMDSLKRFPKITFDSSQYLFGTVKAGGMIHREIHFTNTGETDLIIDLMSACECTTLDWPRSPIRPGQRATIKIRYDSKDKKGPQIVDLEILANTEKGISYTKFKVDVLE